MKSTGANQTKAFSGTLIRSWGLGKGSPGSLIHSCGFDKRKSGSLIHKRGLGKRKSGSLIHKRGLDYEFYGSINNNRWSDYSIYGSLINGYELYKIISWDTISERILNKDCLGYFINNIIIFISSSDRESRARVLGARGYLVRSDAYSRRSLGSRIG